MEKILGRLAYSDFVAYLLPGSISLSFFILILIELGLFGSIGDLFGSSTHVLLFLFSGYSLGVIQSGIAYLFENYNEDPNNVKDVIHEMNDGTLGEYAIKLFSKQFCDLGISAENWNSQYYFLMRTFVQYNSPALFTNSQRQNALRQMRLYLLPTIFIGFVLVVILGLRLSDISIIISYDALVLYEAASVAVFYFIIRNVSKRSRFNRAREKREILCSFIVLCSSQHSDQPNDNTAEKRKAV